LPRFLLGILIFKGLTARRLYKSLGVKRSSCITRNSTLILPQKVDRSSSNLTTYRQICPADERMALI
jgi:hypothetical protein